MFSTFSRAREALQILMTPLFKPCTNQRRCMNQTDAMQCIEKTNNIPHHLVTAGGVSGRATLIDGPSRKTRQYFVQVHQLEGEETEGTLSNYIECHFQGYNVIALPNNVDTSSLYNISTPTNHKSRKFRSTLSSEPVKPSHQAAFQCKELTFPRSSIANEGYLANKIVLHRNTSATPTELLGRTCTENHEYRK